MTYTSSIQNSLQDIESRLTIGHIEGVEKVFPKLAVNGSYFKGYLSNGNSVFIKVHEPPSVHSGGVTVDAASFAAAAQHHISSHIDSKESNTFVTSPYIWDDGQAAGILEIDGVQKAITVTPFVEGAVNLSWDDDGSEKELCFQAGQSLGELQEAA